jgi:hypothetical protein
MSDNSIIFLDIKNHIVRHQDSESPYPKGSYYSSSKHKRLIDAIKKTKKIQDESSPEYGVFLI